MTPEILSHIKGMETVGRLAAETLKFVGAQVRAGMTTDELDKIAYEHTLSQGARPAPLNYHGFPKSICTSVNEVICHGVPDNTVLKEGDIINLDITTVYKGFHGDTSAMFFVGEVSDEARRIAEAAEKCRDRGIEAIVPGAKTGDIGFAVNKAASKFGYWVVRDIGGHGIGTKFHDEPFVPSYGKRGKGVPLKPWKCITVEPMINETSVDMVEHPIPGSTHKYYTTGDKTLSAQYEHTILVTDAGYEILTRLD